MTRRSTARAALRALMMLCVIVIAPAFAEQASIVQPTSGSHTMYDLNQNYLNPALRSLLGNSSGSAAPANGPGDLPLLYQWWVDSSTTPPALRMYDGAQWPALATLDASGHAWSLVAPSAGYRGGVFSGSCSTSQFFTGLGTTGSFACAQPGVDDLAGLGPGVATALENGANNTGGFVTGGYIAPTIGITRAQIPTTSIPAAYKTFVTSGYATTFDGGEGCEWTRATVSAPGAVQSADGAYWALSRDNAIDIKCVGGLTTSSDIYDALIAASNIAKDPSSGSFGLITLSGKYPGGGGTAGYTLNTPGFPLANAQSLSGCQAGRAFLNYTQTTGNALTTAIYAGDSSIECMEMQIQNPTNTATAIQIGNAAYSGGAMFALRDATILNYDTGVRAQGGTWAMNNVKVAGYYSQGVEISNPASPDGGDWVINRLTLGSATPHAPGAAGIRWYSSNGGMVTNVSSVGGDYGVDANMADYAAGGSLVFTGNIIGNADLYAFRFVHQGAGQMGSVVITGNDIPGIPGKAVLFEAGAVADAVFAGNTCGPQPSGTVPMVIENGNTFITIGVNNCFFPNGFADYRIDYNEGGDVHREMTYPHIISSDPVTWKSAWRLQVARNGGGILQVTTEGDVAGDTSVVREDEFLVRHTGGTLTCISKSSTTTGAAIGVQCDTASEPGAVHIQYRTSGPGTTLNGTMSVRTQGHFSRMDAQF